MLGFLREFRGLSYGYQPRRSDPTAPPPKPSKDFRSGVLKPNRSYTVNLQLKDDQMTETTGLKDRRIALFDLGTRKFMLDCRTVGYVELVVDESAPQYRLTMHTTVGHIGINFDSKDEATARYEDIGRIMLKDNVEPISPSHD